MTGMRQAWLVARREMNERGRSPAFRASVLLMMAAVAAMLILPTLFKPGVKDVGLTGPAPRRWPPLSASKLVPRGPRPAYTATPASPQARGLSVRATSTCS